MRRHRRPILFIAGLAAAYGALALLQLGVTRSRAGLLTPGDLSARDRLIELGITVMLGSFRTIAVDYLWYRATQLKERREHTELDGVIRLIARVQPTDIDAFSFQVWNMAYNVQYDAPDITEGWKWVRDAIEFGKKGIRRNPNHPAVWRLAWQLGWVYSHRCADVGDRRTKYFEQQVLKAEGKHTYLVAADWYRKAYEAAIRPGATKPNAVHLAQWAYAYASMARIAEQEDEFDDMLRYRRKATEIHRTLTASFPAYAKHGNRAIAELAAFMALHSDRRLADDHRNRGELDKEVRARTKLAMAWGIMLQKNPHMDEAQRNLDLAADELATLAKRLARPEDQARLSDVKNAFLVARFHAANPQRRSAEAAKKLEDAVAPYDARLGAVSSKSELLKHQLLIPQVSDIWARIISNPLLTKQGEDKTDTAARRKERSEKAEVAIRRFDTLTQHLPSKARGSATREVAEHCLVLITRGSIDSPRAKLRVREAALRWQKDLLSACQAITKGVEHFEKLSTKGAPLLLRRQAANRIMRLMVRERSLWRHTTRYWSALLKRKEAYAQSAKIAEKNLLEVAHALEQAGAAAKESMGERENIFPGQARAVWRMLYEFNPRSIAYLRKARARPRKAPRRGHVH